MALSFDALIPARRGSKRLVGKNLLDMGGEPLVLRAITRAREAGADTIYVSTDDSNIGALATSYGAVHLRRPEHLADDETTLDEVITDVLDKLEGVNNLLVVQPTVVASDDDMDDALQHLVNSEWHESVSIGVKPHSLIWAGVAPPLRGTNFSEVKSYPLQEVGIRFYPQGSESGSINQITEVAGTFVDIDTFADLIAARHLVGKPKRILFIVDHSPFVGIGHLNRALTIAKELQHHEIGFRFVGEYIPDDFPFSVVKRKSSWPADLIVVDVLDTTETEMLWWRNQAPVITFENLGSGAQHANAVVNALYNKEGLHNEYSGADYAILRPEFRNSGFSRKGVLVTFGGGDYLNLTDRLYTLYGSREDFTFVNPPYGNSKVGIKNPAMGKLMNEAAVVVTSAGRTLLEAAACGTSAVVISQNIRETTHSHLGLEYGNVYLGLGSLVSNKQITMAISLVLGNYGLQDDLADRALRSIDGQGLQRVLRIVNEVLM